MSRSETAQRRRESLVESAAKLAHQRGISQTALVDIAREAQVPSGSLYYFFKTKEEIIEAIVARQLADLERSLAKVGASRRPRRRLESLLQIWIDDKDIDTLYGCPFGSLCYEVAKGRGAMSGVVSKPLKLLMQWTEQQFRDMGQGRRSPDLALHLIVSLQGASLVANAFGDPEVIVREIRQLKAWLKQLTLPGGPMEEEAPTKGKTQTPENPAY